MTGDPYVYPGTHTLRNKENIRDREELARLERQAAANRMETLPDNIPMTANGYREIHRYIFQDVYDWAGQDRTVDIARDNSYFCRAQFIAKELEKRFGSIAAENGLRGLSADQFAERAALHISELNHPPVPRRQRTRAARVARAARPACRACDRSRAHRSHSLERSFHRELSCGRP
jgi:cell filamentation protein